MPSILYPPIAFTVMILLAWCIMGLGARIAAQGRPGQGKTRHYACGEDIEMQPIQPNYSSFFSIAFAYSVIHVAALTIITIPSGKQALVGLAYFSIITFAVAAMVSEFKTGGNIRKREPR